MTLEELQAKRDEILATIHEARLQFGDRSEEFITDKAKALAIIDAEIAKLQSPAERQFTIQTKRGLE